MGICPRVPSSWILFSNVFIWSGQFGHGWLEGHSQAAWYALLYSAHFAQVLETPLTAKNSFLHAAPKGPKSIASATLFFLLVAGTCSRSIGGLVALQSLNTWANPSQIFCTPLETPGFSPDLRCIFKHLPRRRYNGKCVSVFTDTEIVVPSLLSHLRITPRMRDGDDIGAAPTHLPGS
jgi:hypothetical protein